MSASAHRSLPSLRGRYFDAPSSLRDGKLLAPVQWEAAAVVAARHPPLVWTRQMFARLWEVGLASAAAAHASPPNPLVQVQQLAVHPRSQHPQVRWHLPVSARLHR